MKKWINKLNIAQKSIIVVAAIFIIAIVSVEVSMLKQTYSFIEAQTSKVVEGEVKKTAVEVNQLMQQTGGVIEDFNKIVDEAASHTNRTTMQSTLEYLITKTPGVKGAFLIYDADAYDDADKYYKSDIGSDNETGRFIPLVYLDNSRVVRTTAKEYQENPEADFYKIPYETGEAYCSEPYSLIFDDESIDVITYSMPIVKEGKTVGVKGIYIELRLIQNICEKTTLYNGFSTIQTTEGFVIANGKDSTQIGKSKSEDKLTKLAEGEAVTQKKASRVFDSMQEVIESNYKIVIPGLGQEWVATVYVPFSDMMIEYGKTQRNLIIQAIIILVVILAIIYFVLKQLMKAAQDIAFAAKRIAVGDLDVNLPKINREDEIGQFYQAMMMVRENTVQITQTMEEIAKGNLKVEIEKRSKADTMAESMQKVVKNLKSLMVETSVLTKSTVEGKLDIRGNQYKFEGGFRKIVEGINQTIDTLVGHINVLPMPLQIFNTHFEVLFGNDAFYNMVGKEKEEVINKKVYELLGESEEQIIEKVKDKCLHYGEKVQDTFALNLNDESIQVESVVVPLKDKEGDIIGAVQLFVDQTEIFTAQDRTSKQMAFQQEEVEKVIANLAKLASGQLNVDIERCEGDEDTQEIAESFNSLNNNLSMSVQSIKGYINEITRVIDKMADSDLDVEIDSEFEGDFKPIKKSLNRIILVFNQILSEINETAEQVAYSADQVSDGSQEVSKGAIGQASTIEELTSSIANIADQTKQNAMNSDQARNVAMQAQEAAAEGNSSMNEMLESMKSINDSSTKISKIIKVIDDIAFQTNILALNAAVEAARAGQHGKGFAVVADEVRNLAAKSANAAKEIGIMINESGKTIKEGVETANASAESLQSILNDINKVTEININIAEASNEQATGIAEVNKGIEQVSEVVQNNSAISEQSASASEELSGQALALKDSISRFNLKTEQQIQIMQESQEKEELEAIAELLDVDADEIDMEAIQESKEQEEINDTEVSEEAVEVEPIQDENDKY